MDRREWAASQLSFASCSAHCYKISSTEKAYKISYKVYTKKEQEINPAPSIILSTD